MQEFILNERIYCENLLNSNDEIKNPRRRLLNLIAQYYYQICGYRKPKVESLLKEFMEKRYPMYIKQKAKWDKVCATMARKTGGRNLLEIKGVAITHAELEAIQRANNKVLERLLFVMLCIAKLNLARNEKKGGWVNTSLQTLCQCANIGGNAWRAIAGYLWIDYNSENIISVKTEYSTLICKLAIAYFSNAQVEKSKVKGDLAITQMSQGSRSVTYRTNIIELDNYGLTAEVKAALPPRKLRVL